MTNNHSASAEALPPSSATNAVLVASEPVPEGSHEVRGVDFDRFQGRDITVAEMVDNMVHMGFQGSAVAEATRIINDMVRWITSVARISSYERVLMCAASISSP
jgi:deoxyhypusine synthase